MPPIPTRSLAIPTARPSDPQLSCTLVEWDTEIWEPEPWCLDRCWPFCWTARPGSWVTTHRPRSGSLWRRWSVGWSSCSSGRKGRSRGSGWSCLFEEGFKCCPWSEWSAGTQLSGPSLSSSLVLRWSPGIYVLLPQMILTSLRLGTTH